MPDRREPAHVVVGLVRRASEAAGREVLEPRRADVVDDDPIEVERSLGELLSVERSEVVKTMTSSGTWRLASLPASSARLRAWPVSWSSRILRASISVEPVSVRPAMLRCVQAARMLRGLCLYSVAVSAFKTLGQRSLPKFPSSQEQLELDWFARFGW